MVQLVEYIMENQNLIYKLCRKKTKNSDLAWDLLQTVYVRAMALQETEIQNLSAYVTTMIAFNHINNIKSFNVKMLAMSNLYTETSDDSEEFLENDFRHKREPISDTDYSPVETIIDTNKILEIMHKICQPGEKQAIVNNLNTDDARSNAFGKSFETLKASRRNGIAKIRSYLGE